MLDQRQKKTLTIAEFNHIVGNLRDGNAGYDHNEDKVYKISVIMTLSELYKIYTESEMKEQMNNIIPAYINCVALTDRCVVTSKFTINTSTVNNLVANELIKQKAHNIKLLFTNLNECRRLCIYMSKDTDKFFETSRCCNVVKFISKLIFLLCMPLIILRWIHLTYIEIKKL
jgi:hypothetical protein